MLDEDLIREAKQHITWLGEQHPELRPEQYGHTLVRGPALCTFACSRCRSALRRVAAEVLGWAWELCQVHDDPFWVRLVSDPRLLSIAARYIGEDIALFASHYIAKPPGDGQPVLFHQDGSCKLLCLHASCVSVSDIFLLSYAAAASCRLAVDPHEGGDAVAGC